MKASKQIDEILSRLRAGAKVLDNGGYTVLIGGGRFYKRHLKIARNAIYIERELKRKGVTGDPKELLQKAGVK